MPGFVLANVAKEVEAEDGGRVVHVRNSAGEPEYYGPEDDKKPVTITVAGSHSTRFRKAERAFNATLMKRSGRSQKDDLSEYNKRPVYLAAACIISWDGFFEDDAESKPWPLTHENATAALESARWVLDDVWEAMNDHAGFSPKNSNS